jgi:hypothetical protein
MSIFNLGNVLLGIIATVTMDVLTVSAIKLRLIAPLSPHLIGRWFASVARGQVLHGDIGQVSPIQHEIAIAVPVHYAIRRHPRTRVCACVLGFRNGSEESSYDS